MRVIARVHAYVPAANGGAEWMLHTLMAELAGRGHQCEVELTHYCPPRKQPWVIDDVLVQPPDTWHPFPAPDAYVTHLENIRPAGDAARGIGRPLIVLMHNEHPTARSDLAFASPSLLVVNSEWMMAQLGHPSNAVMVRPPVGPAAYETTPGDMVTQISLTSGKGGHLFWQVARGMPGTRFLAVQGSYGIQILPGVIPPNVTVLPSMDGRRMREQVYARTRVLLVPSDYESWGRVATEAMCSGIPVIAHRAQGGLAENLGDAAIWADRDDPGTWVTQIGRLSDPGAWAKASEACRKRSAELDPAGDLERWCQAVEALAP